MATECRRTKQRVNRNRLVRLLIVLVVIAAIAFGIGRVTAPAKTKTVTVTKTVEVPVYSTDKLPEVSDIFYFDVPLSHSLQRFIYEVCADENVPVTLIYAMIEHESQFDPEIISKTDDYGLMQINAVNHTWLNEKYRCADMLDPYQNVFCGVKIIGSYVNRYDGDLTKALMAYNMGDYGARKAWENGVDKISYSTTILGLMENYEEVLQNAKGN
jgi:soluble lytic murein transglycosylase-like protein